MNPTGPAIKSIESRPRVALLVGRFKWFTIAAVLTAVVSTSFLLGVAPAAQADPTDVGYRDFNYGSGTANPTSEKPQSKLWFNDGTWWGTLWDPSTQDWYIYRFDWAAQKWDKTSTLVEKRHNARPDVLWDGSHLYVATAPNSTSATDQNAYVRRFSYNQATKTYTLDQGFPATVASGTTETIVLDKDSTGKLWVTFTQGSKVYVNRSLTNDSSWGTPFVLPVNGTSVSSDDISAVIAFDRRNAPPQIGVMWSNQTDGNFYFATHRDGDADNVWQGQIAAGGIKAADDHINLKSLEADSSGRVFAAVKTSFSDLANRDANAPNIWVLVRDTQGAWKQPVTFGRVKDDHTRPIVVIDEQHRNLYVFATAPVSPGGTIYYKRASLDNISFPEGLGTPFIKSSTDTTINNATSSKQNANSTTGILVLAADDTSKYYLHNTIDLAGVDTTPPETTIDSGPSGTVNNTSASFAFSSSETGSSFECSLDGAAFAGCTSPTSYTNLSNGSHTFSVRAIDAAGNVDATPASRTFTVDVPPPPLDTTPPETTIDSGPSGTIKQNNATFSFSSSETNSTFECKLDSAAFSACSSPKKYTGLANGSHTFSVRAKDSAGNTDATPASRTWTVRR